MADSSLDIKMQDLKLSDSPVPALSPDVTPAETYTSAFEATTPLLNPASPSGTFDQEAEVEELLEYDTSSLKSADVKTDPILADLARKQGRPISQTGFKARPSSVAFKARPAPTSTRQEGLGPRMTKSAALRQGLDWAALSSPVKQPTVSEDAKHQFHVPGQKRNDAKVQVASLATPAIAPRATKSSMLRTGSGSGDAGSTSAVKKDYAAQALANKARDKEERERRRKSIALPASLSAPSIAPRQNKSSALRTGVPAPVSSRALMSTTADNLRSGGSNGSKEATTGLVRRASMGVKSLGTPLIAPRLNRAALLRAPGSSSSTSSPKPAKPSVPADGEAKAITAPSKLSSADSIKPNTARTTSIVSPRPTKASLLRAGLGAKVVPRQI